MILETSITAGIVSELRHRGAYVFKVHGGPWQRAGVPDVLAVLDGQMMAIEVKTPGGVASRIQLHELGRIRAAGGHAMIVRSVVDLRKRLDAIIDRRGVEAV